MPKQKKEQNQDSKHKSLIHDNSKSLEKKLEELEKALIEIQWRLHGLFEQTNDAVFIISMDGKYIDVNQRAADMLGCRKEEIIGLNTFDFVHKEEIQDSKEKLAVLQKKRILPLYERRLCKKEGTNFPVEINASLIFDENNNPLYIQSICRDITKRKQTEYELRESEEKFRLTFEKSKDAIFWIDPETLKIINCNNVAEKLLERSKEEIIGQHRKTIHPIEKEEYYIQRFQEMLKKGIADFYGEVITKSGKIIPIHITASKISIKDKTTIQGIFRDISIQKQAEEILAFRLEFEQAISKIMRELIYLPDEEIDKGIKDALQIIGEFTNAKSSFVFTFSDDELLKTIDFYEWSQSPSYSLQKLLQERAHKDFHYFRSLIRKRINIIIRTMDDLPLEEAKGEREWLKKYGFRPMLFVPMIYKKRPYGILGIMGAIGEEREWHGTINILLKFVTGLIITILERKKALDALRESEEKHRAIFSEARDGIVLIDHKTGLIVDANPEFERQTARSLPELQKLKIWEIRPKGKQKQAQEKFEEILKQGFGESRELDFQQPNGNIIPIEFSTRLVKIGEKQYLQSICRDITERKQAEEKLRKSEEMFRLLTENAQDLIFRRSLSDGKYEYLSPAAEIITGYSPEEFYRCPELIEKIMHPDWMSFLHEIREKFQEGDAPPIIEFPIISKSGEAKWLNQRTVLVRDESGKPIFVEGIVTDVTERKNVLEALRESEEKYRTIVENSHAAIVVVDDNFHFIYVNDEASNLFGYSLAEIINSDFREYLDKESIDLVVDRYRLRQKGEDVPSRYEFRVVRKDGEKRDVEVISSIIQNSKGETITIAQLLDITERKQADEKLKQQKEELESFVSTVAHDLRGKLQVIALYNELMKVSEYGNEIAEQIKDIKSFLENLLLLAKEGAILGEFSKINLMKFIQDISNKVISLAPNLQITIKELPIITADPKKLQQVFENLLMNVAKHARATDVKIYSEEDEQEIRLFIQDNGIGISKTKQKEILYSLATKKYTTFGLHIARKIIEAHKGKLTLESEEGKGTTFIIHLPKK